MQNAYNSGTNCTEKLKQNIPAQLRFPCHVAREVEHSLCPLWPHPVWCITGTRAPLLNLQQQTTNWIDQQATNLWSQTDFICLLLQTQNSPSSSNCVYTIKRTPPVQLFYLAFFFDSI
jgi:hypothetical protein